MSTNQRRPDGDIIVGIDIGGTGIKGAPVDTGRGHLVDEPIRVPTPQPSTPTAVAKSVADVVATFDVAGAIGVTFPAIVRQGVVRTAANVDGAWIGVDAARLLEARLGRPVTVLNDADAAGLAEMTFGAGRGRCGVVVMVTFGTGIGTALFLDGRLVPNTELGHIIVSGQDGERLAAGSVKTREMLTWKQWSERANAYFARLESLISPDTIIIGGGLSKDHARFIGHLQTSAEVLPAQLRNDAGIVGAAVSAMEAAGRAIA